MNGMRAGGRSAGGVLIVREGCCGCEGLPAGFDEVVEVVDDVVEVVDDVELAAEDESDALESESLVIVSALAFVTRDVMRRSPAPRSRRAANSGDMQK